MKIKAEDLRDMANAANAIKKIEHDRKHAQELLARKEQVNKAVSSALAVLEIRVLAAAARGSTRITIPVPCPADVASYRMGFLQEVAALVLTELRKAGSDINLSVASNPGSYYGGEDNVDIMASWE